MKKLKQGAMKRLIFSALMLSVLGGCAVYAPPPVPYGYSQPVYAPAPAPYAYSQPQTVYVAPPPVYVAPPVFFNFGFWRWGGHHGGRHR